MFDWFSSALRRKQEDDDAQQEGANAGSDGQEMQLEAENAQEAASGDYKNLYEEASECLLASMTIYGFADLRAVAATNEKLSSVLTIPQSRTDLLRTLLENEDEIKLAKLDTTMYMSALDKLAPNMLEVLNEPSNRKLHDPVEIVAFDDAKSAKELVYSITVDHFRKLIRITFRGSTTVTDWAYDADIRMEFMPNPLHYEQQTGIPHTIRQSSKIGLHAGFRNYLFSSTDEKVDNEAVPRSPIIESVLPAKVIRQGVHCKYDCILRHLKTQLALHPTYRIQCTGHSLGGALCTLLSFCLACELESIPNGPITCISYASPRVGNGNFGRAFFELERRGRLRNVRVANAEDAVTAMPDTHFTLSFLTHAMRRNFFLHTGACLQLHDTEDAKWVYPQVSQTKDGHFKDDWKHRTENMMTRARTLGHVVTGQADFMKWHSCEEYLERLQSAKDMLSEMSFDSVYESYFSMSTGGNVDTSDGGTDSSH
jgi:hypothetical protein